MLKKLLLALACLLILGLIAWQYLKPVPATAVNTVATSVQMLSTTLDLNATVINDRIVTITALLDGEIGQIEISEGDAVEKGQVLAQLNNLQAQSLLDRARAELTYNRQKLNTTSRNYSRFKNLSKDGDTSKQNLDDALDAFRSAEAQMIISSSNVTLAELQLKNGTLNAPFAGIVTEQFAEAGQWVEAGTPLFRLVAKDAYLIEAFVDASDWSLVSLNQNVSLTTESAPDAQWLSRVSWISSSVVNNERNAKSVAIRFPFGDEAPPLLLSQEVDAELVLEQVDDALTLPLWAMVETDPGEFSVFIEDDDTAKLIPVSVGLLNATHAQITSGITERDKVIVASEGQLQDGMPVTIE